MMHHPHDELESKYNPHVGMSKEDEDRSISEPCVLNGADSGQINPCSITNSMNTQ